MLTSETGAHLFVCSVTSALTNSATMVLPVHWNSSMNLASVRSAGSLIWNSWLMGAHLSFMNYLALATANFWAMTVQASGE